MDLVEVHLFMLLEIMEVAIHLLLHLLKEIMVVQQCHPLEVVLMVQVVEEELEQLVQMVILQQVEQVELE